MKKYLELLRIKHYIKNILIFIPAFFGKTFFNIYSVFYLLVGFLSFSLVSSFIYIVNDIRDLEVDKKHEVKRDRPIASGKITVRRAVIIAIFLIILSFLVTIFICRYKQSITPLYYIILYLALNIIYSFGIKNKVIIDIFIVASGFVIRMLYGASIINISCSNWLLLTIMSISMYLGLGKRKNELIKVCDGTTRKVLKKYSVNYLNNMMHIFLTSALVFYALWSINTDENTLIWTFPLIIAIIMKYELDISDNSWGDPVEVIINDKILIGLLILYIFITFIIIYFI